MLASKLKGAKSEAAVSGGQQFIAYGAASLQALQWSGSGFGAPYTNAVGVTNITSIAASQQGDAVAVSLIGSPYVAAFPWSASGFGTKYTNPATLPTNVGTDIAFSPLGDAVAVTYRNTSPYIAIYPWSSSGFGTKYADPATLPAGSVNSVAFSPGGDVVAFAHRNAPRIAAYPWSGNGFGTKFSDPATSATSDAGAIAFSPLGDSVAIATFSSPFIHAYPWSPSGFGTKFSDPVTPPPAAIPVGCTDSLSFSPSGDAIAVAVGTGSTLVAAYPWSGSGFGAQFPAPPGVPISSVSAGRAVAFSKSGDAIIVGHSAGGGFGLSAWSWSPSGFGVKFPNPSFTTTQPTGIAFGEI